MTDSAMEKILGMDAEKGRWALILLGMIINLCLGSVYAWSVFVGPLTTYFTKDLGQAVTAIECIHQAAADLLTFPSNHKINPF